MIIKKPFIRLSFALALLTVNILFAADLIGFLPNTTDSVLELRKGLSESMALQFSAVAEKGEFQIIQNTLRAVVDRNEDIHSAAIRGADGRLIALAGDHLAHWNIGSHGKSTPTHVHVPVYRQGKKWATVQIRFGQLWANSQTGGFAHSFAALTLFVGLSCFILYSFIIKRTLRELDPSAVIPGRVSTAFNALREGVLLLDDKEQIVMVNTSLADIFGREPESMIGLKGSELGWLNCQTPQQIRKLPWLQVLEDGLDHTTASIMLSQANGSKIKFVVNAVKVSDGAGYCRGSLATFDDITQMEEKNFELNDLVEKLRQSKKEIQTKSQELEFLASRDPMTRCLNRRALDNEFDSLFTEANVTGAPLSCLMVDIDFFKSVNDRFGHATGDDVIKAVADVLRSCTREKDIVGRYGGEEFCVVLPELDLRQAAQVAERIRKTIEDKDCAGVQITSSLGVSSLEMNPGKPDDMVNQADKALYAAKKGGRNRVVTWGHNDTLDALADTSDEPSPLPAKVQEDRAAAKASRSQLEDRIQELEGFLEKCRIESEHYEMYDIRTGWPTRSLFEDRISHEIARNQRKNAQLAVLSIAIDTIEQVEKTLGQNAATQLVTACGHRLNDVLRQNYDTVAVMEGIEQISTVSLINQTEFGVLLSDIKQIDHVTWIIKRLLDIFETPFQIQGQEIYISAYIGVGIFPYDGQTVEEIYSSAANACSYAKNMKDGNRYRFASQDINAAAIKQLQIESALHRAVDNEEFELYFQPLVETGTARVLGFEALLRWTSTKMGSVPPTEFIPVAEQSGQIQKIGDWVLYQACKQLRGWLDAGYGVDRVAVNLSGLQLRQPNLAHRIEEILNEFHLAPHLLEIELTESALVHAHDPSFTVLKQIKALGIRVAMDDFGTGYSSLAYLKDIPLSSIKIDRSFINAIGKNDHSEKLIESIVSMAHGLGLKVVGEGVEEKQQADYLAMLGCEYMQGYLFGRPVPPNEAVGFLVKSTKRLHVA